MNTTAKRITLTSQRECLSHKTNSAYWVIYVVKHCLDTCVRRVGWTFRRNGANNISSKWFFSWLVRTHSISSSCLTCDLASTHLPYCHSGTGPACYFLLPYNKFQIFIFVLLKSLLFLASWFPVLSHSLNICLSEAYPTLQIHVRQGHALFWSIRHFAQEKVEIIGYQPPASKLAYWI